MHGNAAEWVEDCWHNSPMLAPINAVALTSGANCKERIVKGGSWYDLARDYTDWMVRSH